MKVCMIGTGAWGRAVGAALCANGHSVEYLSREVTKWPEGLRPDYLFLGLATQSIRSRLAELSLPNAPLVSLCKGIEVETGERVSRVVKSLYPNIPVAVLSGPSFAMEVERGQPTAVVVGAENEELGKEVQVLLHQKMLRVYRSSDLTGVELGGALKNVYAIAAGVCDGLRMGENAMAGLVTRSLAEMLRIGLSMGAKQETFFGLSGVGDLMLTCYSGRSRNHQVGKWLAEGAGLEEVLSKVEGVAEGVPTTKAVYQYVSQRNIKAPIVSEVYQLLWENKPPLRALNDLMLREPNEE